MECSGRWGGRWGSRLRRGSTPTRPSRFSVSPSRYGWVALPPAYQVLQTTGSSAPPWCVCHRVRGGQDSPGVDSILGRGAHRHRPRGGAVIAVATLGEQSAATETIRRALGGALAASTHFSKAGTRAMANASPSVHELGDSASERRHLRRQPRVLALKFPPPPRSVVPRLALR